MQGFLLIAAGIGLIATGAKSVFSEKSNQKVLTAPEKENITESHATSVPENDEIDPKADNPDAGA